MRIQIFSTLVVICLLSGLTGAQSLTEVAKKEKERRKKIKEQGEQVQVITESELEQTRPGSAPSAESSSESTGSPEASAPNRSGSSPNPSRPSTVPSRRSGAEVEGGGGTPTEIPRNAEMRDKIAVFEQMLAAYREEVRDIDAQIAKNNARIEEIEQQLNTMGAGGFVGGRPTAPTAPQADRSVQYEGNAPTLQAEQQSLRQKNQELEATKARKASELRQKGRAAGIPAGYLRF